MPAGRHLWRPFIWVFSQFYYNSALPAFKLNFILSVNKIY